MEKERKWMEILNKPKPQPKKEEKKKDDKKEDKDMKDAKEESTDCKDKGCCGSGEDPNMTNGNSKNNEPNGENMDDVKTDK